MGLHVMHIITAPSPDGYGAAMSMKNAMKRQI